MIGNDFNLLTDSIEGLVGHKVSDTIKKMLTS